MERERERETNREKDCNVKMSVGKRRETVAARQREQRAVHPHEPQVTSSTAKSARED